MNLYGHKRTLPLEDKCRFKKNTPLVLSKNKKSANGGETGGYVVAMSSTSSASLAVINLVKTNGNTG